MASGVEHLFNVTFEKHTEHDKRHEDADNRLKTLEAQVEQLLNQQGRK